jgi:hypothetical protein
MKSSNPIDGGRAVIRKCDKPARDGSNRLCNGRVARLPAAEVTRETILDGIVVENTHKCERCQCIYGSQVIPYCGGATFDPADTMLIKKRVKL